MYVTLVEQTHYIDLCIIIGVEELQIDTCRVQTAVYVIDIIAVLISIPDPCTRPSCSRDFCACAIRRPYEDIRTDINVRMYVRTYTRAVDIIKVGAC